MNSHQLAIRALHSERGDRVLFSNLNLTLNSAEGLHIVGANGSGKTSLLRLVAGLLSPQAGHILWNQRHIHADFAHYTANSCFIGHQNGVNKHLSPLENCYFMMALRQQVCSKHMIVSALEQVELFGFEHEPAKTLSAGQQRRIALAQLVLSEAPLWILDEPYTALDTYGITLLDQLCKRHINHGGILVFASHQPSALDQHASIQRLVLKN